MRHTDADLDLSRPRTIPELLATTVALYWRLPLVFVFAAGVIVVPYYVVLVVIEHGSSVKLGTELLLGLVQLALIGPCVATLEVQALLSLGEGRRPRLADVVRRGVVVLPTVAAAQIVASIGIIAGFAFFIVPGVILALRWAVVAQVAAVERTQWPTSIRRSGELTRRNYLRILGIVVTVGVIDQIPSDVIGRGDHLGVTIAGILLALIAYPFGTLLTSLLYFDLRARESA